MSLGTFLNGRQPDRPRGLLMLALSDTAMILTRTYTDDTGGGASMVWGTAVPSVACRIDPLAAGSRGVTAGRLDERSTHVVTVPSGTDVSADDRIAITDRGTFEITATRERTAEWSRMFEVVAAS